MDAWLAILMVVISSMLSAFSTYIFFIISCNSESLGNDCVAPLLAAVEGKKALRRNYADESIQEHLTYQLHSTLFVDILYVLLECFQQISECSMHSFG